MNILDHNSDTLETIFRLQIRKFFDADPDPVWEMFDPRSGINIPDPQHCAKVFLYD
jgi:hypothetical protein